MGAANICPDVLLRHTVDTNVAIIVHELMHSLGFSAGMFSMYVDDAGAPRPKSTVMSTMQRGGRRVNVVTLPTVVQEARAHFDCPTLAGAPLEDQGGEGSVDSHWEYQLFQVRVLGTYIST